MKEKLSENQSQLEQRTTEKRSTQGAKPQCADVQAALVFSRK
jgi:hypothetical protein